MNFMLHSEKGCWGRVHVGTLLVHLDEGYHQRMSPPTAALLLEHGEFLKNEKFSFLKNSFSTNTRDDGELDTVHDAHN